MTSFRTSPSEQRWGLGDSGDGKIRADSRVFWPEEKSWFSLPQLSHSLTPPPKNSHLEKYTNHKGTACRIGTSEHTHESVLRSRSRPFPATQKHPLYPSQCPHQVITSLLTQNHTNSFSVFVLHANEIIQYELFASSFFCSTLHS